MRSTSGPRRGRVIIVALAALVGVGWPASTLDAQPASPPEIRARFSDTGDPYHERVAGVLRESLARYHEWLGPRPGDRSEVLLGSAPWRSDPATMDVESKVAFSVARSWWPRVKVDPATSELADAAAWYLQSRVVERLFDFSFFVEGHSADRVRFFGGTWPWAFRALPLSRWSGGLGRLEYVTGSIGARPFRGAIAFATLERYLTWPVLQGALREWVQRAAAAPLSRSDSVRIISAAAGQDLSWFFDSAFDPRRRFDYAVTGLSSEARQDCGSPGCYLTRATAARRGDAQFTGSSRAPQGSYENGDALKVRITFADGQQATARWDGRAAEKTWEFESRSPAVAVHLDPDRTLLLDENLLNNSLVTASPTNVPVGKWVARWLVWLQDAMLTYAF